MRRTPLVAILLFCSWVFTSFVFGQTTSPQTASSQTARQALLEMFFSDKPNHLEKHLPDVTLRSVRKLSSPDSPSVLAEFSMIASQIKAEGTSFQMFDTGPTLLTAEDPRGGGPDKVELTVERDDLIGDEDQIELALHMYKNGKEESLPVIPRFTFSMQSEADVWRLNEISVTVRVPLSDPNFLKTIEDRQRSRNEQMTIFALQQVNSAEKAYSARQGHYACTLSALVMHKGELWDAQLASGKKNGYVLVISSCDPTHYKVVAEPAVDDSGQRAFCSDESGSVRAASDGKVTTCLSNGEVVQEGMAELDTAIAAASANPPANTQAAAASQKQPRAVLRPESPTSGTPGPMPTRIRVSQGVMKGLLVKEVQPVYPTMEKINIEGNVLLSVIIDKDGTVQSAKVVNTPSPMLNGAALDAVKQWKFRPYLLNGSPLEVETTITVNFTLPKK